MASRTRVPLQLGTPAATRETTQSAAGVEAFIRGADVQTAPTSETSTQAKKVPKYPWQGVDPKETDKCYSGINKKLMLKLTYIQAQTQLTKRRVYERAFSCFIEAYFKEHGIPND